MSQNTPTDTVAQATTSMFAAPLYRPPSSAKARWHRREGLLLSLRDGAGRVGQGEASPLPGYSPDALDACALALGGVDPASLGSVDPSRPVAPQLSAVSRSLDATPAARFALETALLDLWSQQLQVPAWQLLGGSARTVPLTALLPRAGDGDLIEATRDALERGVSTVKAKLGADLAIELPALREWRREFGSSVKLRLDFNQTLPAERVRDVLDQVAQLEPQFVEEPSPLGDWAAAAPVPLAVDESLQSPNRWNELAMALPNTVTTFVRRPRCSGSLRPSRKLPSGS